MVDVPHVLHEGDVRKIVDDEVGSIIEIHNFDGNGMTFGSQTADGTGKAEILSIPQWGQVNIDAVNPDGQTNFSVGGTHDETQQISIGNASIIVGSVDPSAGEGFPKQAGCLFIQKDMDGNGTWWFKTGPNATAWVKLAPLT